MDEDGTSARASVFAGATTIAGAGGATTTTADVFIGAAVDDVDVVRVGDRLWTRGRRSTGDSVEDEGLAESLIGEGGKEGATTDEEAVTTEEEPAGTSAAGLTLSALDASHVGRWIPGFLRVGGLRR